MLLLLEGRTEQSLQTAGVTPPSSLSTELYQTEFHHVRTLKIMSEVYYKGIQKELQLDTHTLDKVTPSHRPSIANVQTGHVNLIHLKCSVDFPGVGRPVGDAHTVPHPAAGAEESFIHRGAEQQQLPHLLCWRRSGQSGEETPDGLKMHRTSKQYLFC